MTFLSCSSDSTLAKGFFRSLQIMFHKIDYPFLIGAFVSFLASVSLWFLVSHEYGLFVGIWVPSILSLWVGVRVVVLSHGINSRKGL